MAFRTYTPLTIFTEQFEDEELFAVPNPDREYQLSVYTIDPITILVTQKLVALKRYYNCLIAQFVAHNSIYTTSQYTCISSFITGSICHLLTI